MEFFNSASHSRSSASSSLLFLLSFILFCSFIPLITDAAKILVYCPSISKSHVLLCGKYADLLHNAQHDTILFIPTYASQHDSFNGAKQAKVWRLHNISDAFDSQDGSAWVDVLEKSNIGFFERIAFEYYFWIPMCRAVASQRNRLQHLIDYNFDLAIVGDVDDCNHAIVRSLGIKKVIMLSSEPIMDKVAWTLGLPSPPSFVPSVEENDNHDVMGFYDRMRNTYIHLNSLFIHYLTDNWITEICREHFDPNFPSVRNIIQNVSLVFINSNQMFDLPKPISPKFIYVGMLEGDEQKLSLSGKVEEALNKGKLGSVFISFGTVAPFNILPHRIQASIYNAVKEFQDYHFILKILPDDTTSPEIFSNLSNIDLLDWVPQNAVLRHQNLKLFVSHGGMNSVLESMTYGVPMFLMPIFTDQFRNAKNVEKHGAGEMIRREKITADTFRFYLGKILNNESYKLKAKRVSKLMKERPFTPEETVVNWVDFVHSYDIFENMNLEGNNLSSIAYYHIDILILLITFLFTIKYLWSLTTRLISKNEKKSCVE